MSSTRVPIAIGLWLGLGICAAPTGVGPAEPQDRASFRAGLDELMAWFESSGIMPQPNGEGGVHERFIVDLEDPARHRLAAHVRADCTFQAGLLFSLYGELTDAMPWRARGRRMMDYPRGTLQELSQARHAFGLFTWSNEHPDTYWTDDNAWNTVLQLRSYALTGHEPDLYGGLLCAESLLSKRHLLIGYEESDQSHWGAFYTMAMAAAYAYTQDGRFLAPCRDYVRRRLKDRMWMTAAENPHLTNGSSGPTAALIGVSVYYEVSGDEQARRLLDELGGFLIASLDESGALQTSWDWWLKSVPLRESRPYVDLVYGHNFACLGFLQAQRATGDARYAKALRRALRFACEIQIEDHQRPWLNGAWRGAYDPRHRRWDGPSQIVGGEGGPQSVYSGWTNAPLGLALVLALSGEGLLPSQDWLRRHAPDIQRVHERVHATLRDAEGTLEHALADKRANLLKAAAAQAARQGNLALGKRYRVDPPNTRGRYFDDTGIRLTDGQQVEQHFSENRSLSWLHRRSVEIVLDLEKPARFNKVAFSSLGSGYGGCEYPNAAWLLTSADASEWVAQGEFEKQPPRFRRPFGEQELSASTYVCDVAVERPYRWIKIRIDHRGKADLHLDEIMVIAP